MSYNQKRSTYVKREIRPTARLNCQCVCEEPIHQVSQIPQVFLVDNLNTVRDLVDIAVRVYRVVGLIFRKV